jgi:hypothetical protein
VNPVSQSVWLICTELLNAAPLLVFYVHVVSAWAITLSSATFIVVATESVGCILVIGQERKLKIPIEMANARALFSDLTDRCGADSSQSSTLCTRAPRVIVGERRLALTYVVGHFPW